MNVTSWSYRSVVSVVVISLTIVVLAVYFSMRLPIGLLPDFEVPKLTISIVQPDLSPQELERDYLKPIREQLFQITGLTDYSTVAMKGNAYVFLDFRWGTPMDYAFIELNEFIDKINPLLPRNTMRPIVLRHGTYELAAFQLVQSSSKDRLMEDSKFAQNVLKRRFEQLPGISKCEILGDRQSEITVRFKPDAIRRGGTTITEIIKALREANTQFSGIKVSGANEEITLKIDRAFEKIEDLKKFPVFVADQQFPLSHFANISLDPSPGNFSVIKDGDPHILLRLYPSSGSNFVDLSTKIRECVEQLGRNYKNLSLEIIDDQSLLVKASIGNLFQSLFFGGLLAIVLLVFTLRNIEFVGTISLLLILSVSLTIIFLYVLGLSLNILSMAGLITATGILIDNGIILVENIDRLGRSEQDPGKLILNSIGDIRRPLIASTLTTICIFVPLSLSRSISGLFFLEQAISISVGLLSSLFVAFILLPGWYRLGKRIFVPKASRSLEESGLKKYARWISAIYNKRQNFILILLGLLLVIGAISFLKVPKRVFPSYSSPGVEAQLTWNVQANHNTLVDLSLEVYQQAELNKDFDSPLMLIGSFQDIALGFPQQPYQSTFRFIGPQKEKAIERFLQTQSPYVESIKEEPSKSLLTPFIPVEKAPIILQISNNKGEGEISAETIHSIVDRLRKSLPNTTIQLPYSSTFSLWVIEPNKEKLLEYNLSEQEIYNTINYAFGRKFIDDLYFTNDKISLVAEVVAQNDSVHDMFERLLVEGTNLPLASFIHVSKKESFQNIFGGKGGVLQQLFLYPQGGDKNKIKELVSSLSQEFAIDIDVLSQKEEAEEFIWQILIIFGMTILLLYLILAAQFESFVSPLLVMAVLPSSTAGSLIAQWIWGVDLNLMSGIGLIVTLGIAVNDTILKVDTIGSLRKTLSLKAALEEASHIRLRPILLTSISTILAVLPVLMVSGIGRDIQTPFIISLIGGMVFSTLFSIWVLPVLYLKLSRAFHSI